MSGSWRERVAMSTTLVSMLILAVGVALVIALLSGRGD